MSSWSHKELKVLVKTFKNINKFSGVIYVPITSGTRYTYVKTENPIVTKHKNQFFIHYDRTDPYTGFHSHHIGLLDTRH